MAAILAIRRWDRIGSVGDASLLKRKCFRRTGYANSADEGAKKTIHQFAIKIIIKGELSGQGDKGEADLQRIA